ncbi:DUF2249 domain-containing protein [Haloplanus rallus]|uniref:DUF2249 domain-containing protein n=1 Tax=Haloplanus rallus TaxID=1816183 RepID=A0A6B9F2C4_9EURY|nr:DUF2249 domain-containing protein [Haloplanus rallus]QGX94368.1 DUF2249 domain-containing protein [Haloplanus rallus]
MEPTAEVDLRERPSGEHRARLFEVLAAADAGDEVAVVAERDVDPHLVRYVIERGRALDWTYADPDAEPRELRVTVGDPLDDARGTVDVRDLKPRRRHRVLLETFDELGAGEGFVLVNDHDPKPLYHELESMHGDVVEWEYASRGGGEWRVEVVKTEASDADDEGVVTRYDVREIPKAERHPTIHHRYGMIPAGGTMELVASHEPRPLRREFRQQYGDSFTWEVVESEPGRCRVRITKDASVDASSTADESADADGVSAAPADDESIDVIEELDVRDLPPAQRHERIFDAYDALDPGTGVVVVNDHDPKPLYHQFDAEAGPAFRWEYRARDPGEFRVLIGRAETAADGATDEGPSTPF